MILHLSINVTGFSGDQVDELRDNILMQLDNTEAKLVSSNITDSRGESFVAASIAETPVPKRKRPYISSETARIAVRSGLLMRAEEAAAFLGKTVQELHTMMAVGALTYEIAKNPESGMKRFYVYTNSVREHNEDRSAR